jgi:hypothetical protein
LSNKKESDEPSAAAMHSGDRDHAVPALLKSRKVTTLQLRDK